jgi:hypothetical protein
LHFLGLESPAHGIVSASRFGVARGSSRSRLAFIFHQSVFAQHAKTQELTKHLCRVIGMAALSLNDVPLEILSEILGFLDAKTLLSCSSVCPLPVVVDL